MTHWTDAAELLAERGARTPGLIARYAPGTLAFALSAALGVYLVYLRAPAHIVASAPETPVESNAFGGLTPAPVPPVVAETQAQGNPFGSLVTKGFGGPSRFQITESPVPIPPVPPADLRPQVADDDGVPLPPRRPGGLRPADPVPAAPSVARLEPRPAPSPAAAPAAPAGPGLFERLFGGGTTTAPKAPSTTMAYAAPPPSAGASSAASLRSGVMAPNLGAPSGGGGFLRGLNFSGPNPTSRYGERVAVYDISRRVVYMPDGTQLEAHSGLGPMRDDPSSVAIRMKGVTPPATYSLTPREALFHGVEALRLTPLDSNVFGRAGLLAHTYMLGPDGDSNGCISFRDYDAFLRAYRNGVVNKLVVVTRL